MTESTQDKSQGTSHDGGEDAQEGVGIADEQLPEDLQPRDDNPLAKPPSDEDDDEGGMSLGPDGPQA
jgi:hypothetical protein